MGHVGDPCAYLASKQLLKGDVVLVVEKLLCGHSSSLDIQFGSPHNRVMNIPNYYTK